MPTTASPKPSIAVIPGDGIGPEVIQAALTVLEAAVGTSAFELQHYELGAEHWLATGEVLPAERLTELSHHDAILLGAIGADPRSTAVPSGLLERGLLLKLRFAFDHDVNLRPARWYSGTTSPLAAAVLDRGPIDFLVVREGTEGPYAGNGGAVRVGTAHEIATEVSVNTAFGVERVMRFAYEQARNRRGRLTLLHKTNVLVHAGGLWRRIFDELSEEYPDVERDYLHIDAATIMLVTDPQRFDVIVTDNLFGDIITDQAAAITGGIGLAPSANINTARQFPSMFEPVHGSAPDIAGRGLADPTAAIASVSLLLRHLGHGQAASRIDAAIVNHLAARKGRQLGTEQITEEITALLTD